MRPHRPPVWGDWLALAFGERQQVTVLFADLKGSMELLADRDPEEARKLLDPVLEAGRSAVFEGSPRGGMS